MLLFTKKKQMSVPRAKENIIPPKQVEKIIDDVFEDLSRMIGCTIGPAGGNTLVTEPYAQTPIFPTKDGFRVMNNHTYDDIPYESIYRIIRDICGRMNAVLGDATTSGVIIADDFRKRIKKYLKKHREITPFGIKKILDTILKVIQTQLTEKGYVIKFKHLPHPKKVEIYRKIATISANNDSTIGNMVAEAYAKSGSDYTFIDIRESPNEEDHIQLDMGFEIPSGYIDRHMANDTDGITSTYSSPYYLIIDGPIIAEDVPALQQFVEWSCLRLNTPLVIIAAEYCKEAVDYFVKCRSAFPIMDQNGNRAVVKLPLLALIVSTVTDRGVSRIQDLEICLGAKALQTNNGKLQNPPETVEEFRTLVGRSDKIVSKPYESHILGGAGSVEEREARIKDIEDELRKQADASRGNILDQSRMEYMKRRAGMLKGDMHCIEVGGDSFKEKRSRMLIFEDAILAVKAAINNGIMLGGQVSTAHLIHNNKEELVKMIKSILIDNANTFNIVLKASRDPFYIRLLRQIGILRKISFENTIGDILTILEESALAAYNRVFENATNDRKFIKQVMRRVRIDKCTYNLITGKFEKFMTFGPDEVLVPDLIVPGNTDSELLTSVFAILGLFLTSNQLLSVITAEEKRNKT